MHLDERSLSARRSAGSKEMRHGTHSKSKRKQWALRPPVNGDKIDGDDHDRARGARDIKRDCSQSIEHYRAICHVSNGREASRHDDHAAGVVMGSNARFTMDPTFARNFNTLVRGTLHEGADEQEHMLASLRSRFKGQPIAVIKPVLAREWSGSAVRLRSPNSRSTRR
jgi:hypothetical protein